MLRRLLAIRALAAVLTCAGAALARPPRGLVVDRAGRVWFSDLKSIWKIDEHGRGPVMLAQVPVG